MAYSIENITFIDLPIMSCGLMDLSLKANGTCIDCSVVNNDTCIRCSFRGRFFTEEGIDDVSSFGHVVCLFLWILTFVIGICAILGNVIIIIVLKGRNTRSGFNIFLIGLASSDLACCLLSILGTTAVSIFYRKI